MFSLKKLVFYFYCALSTLYVMGLLKVFTHVGNRAFFAKRFSGQTNISSMQDQPMVRNGNGLFREIFD